MVVVNFVYPYIIRKQTLVCESTFH